MILQDVVQRPDTVSSDSSVTTPTLPVTTHDEFDQLELFDGEESLEEPRKRQEDHELVVDACFLVNGEDKVAERGHALPGDGEDIQHDTLAFLEGDRSFEISRLGKVEMQVVESLEDVCCQGV